MESDQVCNLLQEPFAPSLELQQNKNENKQDQLAGSKPLFF
jgi:hypothetical protein